MGRIAFIFIFFIWIPVRFSPLKANETWEKINVTSLNPSGKNFPDYISCMAQDADGFLWVGTQNGLFKFDGYSFSPVSLNEGAAKETLIPGIIDLYEDSRGNIWTITSEGSVFYYNTQKDSIKFIKKLQNYTINSIYQGDSARFYFGTIAGELIEYNQTLDTLKNYTSPERNPIVNILSVSKDLLFLNYEKPGTIHFSRTAGNFFYSEIDDQLKDHHIRSAISSENKNIIFASDKGLFQITTDDRLIQFKSFDHLKELTDPPYVLSMLEINDSVLFIGTDGQGLLNYNLNTNQITRVHINSEVPLFAITSLYLSAQDKIWIGTTNSGIHVYDPLKTTFFYWKYEKGNSTGVSSNCVLALSEMPDGNILIGLDGGGINLFDKEKQRFFHYKDQFPDIHVANSIVTDRHHNIWIGTHWNGLKLFTMGKENQLIEKELPFPMDKSVGIKYLFEDSAGNIWISRGGDGVYVYNPLTNNLQQLTFSPFLNNTATFYEDSNSLMWIGTDNGVLKYHSEAGKWEHILYQRPGFSQFRVNSILETGNNDIWFGTTEGLWNINKNRQDTSFFTVRDGLPANQINGLLFDGTDHLWCSTARGISVFNMKAKKFRNFSDVDGVLGYFNQNAILKTTEKKFFFGNTTGIYCFDPHNIKNNEFKPPIFLKTLTLEKSSSDSLANCQKAAINLKRRNEVRLSHKQNTFSIEFIALNYTLPNKNQYKYQLKGFDKGWVEMENLRPATYTNLPPGEYVFTVQAANNDGVWNSTGRSMNIIINPPWYKTSWALALWTILLMGMILMVNRYILIQIRLKDSLRMERAQKEKQHEINQNKLQFFTNITHDLRSPLTLIISPVEKLLKSTSPNSTQYQQLSLIKKNADRLLKLIDQILEFRKTEQGTKKLEAGRHDLVALLNNLHHSWQEWAQKKKIRFSFLSRFDKFYLWVDVDTIEKILHNLLSNAFKFTPEYGNIDIVLDIDRETKEARIEVRDNGSGIDEKEQPYIFNRFYQSPKYSSNGTGIGLALVKRLVEIHHGRLSLDSQYGKGSRFIIKIPLGKSYLSPEEFAKHYPTPKNQKKEEPKDTCKPLMGHNQGQTKIKADFSIEKQYAVLVVEDDKDLRRFIAGELSDYFQVYEAENGDEGFTKAEKWSPDVIVSDILMEPVDGISFCKKIKNNFETSHIPIILLTALSSEEKQLEGLETGAEDYITKPCNINILILKIKNLLEDRQKLITRFKTEILMEPENIAPSNIDETFLNDTVNLIRQNISDPSFKLEKLISEAGMSRSAFFKKIKALTGLSPHNFILLIKMKHAAQLLVKSQLYISEVATETGFLSLKHFSRCFKKYYGVNPSEYKQNQKSNMLINQGKNPVVNNN